MSNEPRSFTVLSVTHGERRDLLQQNIESVANQLTDGEDIAIRHIVLDNGSTDDTADYLRSLEGDDDFRHLSYVVSPEAVTVGAAYNRLIDVAQSRCSRMVTDAYASQGKISTIARIKHNFTDQYVVPLDGDDTLEERGILALEYIIRDAEQTKWTSLGKIRHAPPCLVFGSSRITDVEGRPYTHPDINFAGNSYPADQDYLMQSIWTENRIVTGTAAIWIGGILLQEGWDESAHLGASDWELWARLIAFGADFRHDPTRAISTYRQHDGQTSRQHEAAGTWRRDGLRIRQKLLHKFAGCHVVSHFTNPSSEWFRSEAMTADLVGDEIAGAPETVFLGASSYHNNDGSCLNCKSRQKSAGAGLPPMSADYKLAPIAPRLRHRQR